MKRDTLPWPTEPHHIGKHAHKPSRVYRDDPPNPWAVRLLVYSILIVVALVLGVLVW